MESKHNKIWSGASINSTHFIPSLSHFIRSIVYLNLFSGPYEHPQSEKNIRHGDLIIKSSKNGTVQIWIWYFQPILDSNHLKMDLNQVKMG